MTNILFICHGNICRSTMAEFLMKDIVCKAGREADFYIESAATSREEIGNDIHRGTKAKLREVGVPFSRHQARQVTKTDYENFDYLIVMDQENIRGLNRIIGSDPEGKVYKLLDFAGKDRDIADPWYTGNFDDTYDDIMEGLTGFCKTVSLREYGESFS
ncbi:MAG: low molecular weight protein-tyrosine-phosphatase [Emergencia sp.]|nr:low molecular weight protein-tyrosine-phosphatase [Emergencia sp.]